MELDWLCQHLSTQTCYVIISMTLVYVNRPQLRQPVLVLALSECYYQQAAFLIAIATIGVVQTSS